MQKVSLLISQHHSLMRPTAAPLAGVNLIPSCMLQNQNSCLKQIRKQEGFSCFSIELKTSIKINITEPLAVRKAAF